MMRSCLAFMFAGNAMGYFLQCSLCCLLLAGCGESSSTRVQEVYCAENSGGLDANKLCVNPDRPGDEVEIDTDAAAQSVRISVLKSDDHSLLTELSLRDCAITDRQNWTCKLIAHGNPGEPNYVGSEYGMMGGRYYVRPDGLPGYYYTSSISGFPFWALRHGLIKWRRALKASRLLAGHDKKRD
jgi:hypothetical protein